MRRKEITSPREETIGRMGNDLIGKLCEIISRYTGQERSVIQYHWKARLLVILTNHRFEAATLHDTAQFKRTISTEEIEEVLEFNDIPLKAIKKAQQGLSRE